jgi:hypothetical protein
MRVSPNRSVNSSAIVNWLSCGLIFSVLSALASSAHAIGDHIRFTQAASGTISATLAGSVDPCKGSNIFPTGVASINLNGNEYDIASFFAILDPLPCPDIPQPYEQTASLGNPSDGHYLVVWTVGPLTVTGAFEVIAGVLKVATNSVPTLTLPALSSLIVMVVLIGLVLFRWQRRW